MALFPTISSGSVMCYSSSFGTEYLTGIVRFVNDSEQRWAERAPLARATLVFADISSYDLSTLQGFWQSYKGMYVDAALSNVFELSFTDASGNSYDWKYCIFEQNDFTATETKPGCFSLSLKVRQVRKNS
jgi:hypothetical protein